ncbi:hypothetical protein L1987_12130 [Smallanthus sonchifolius]|uniref:Uncharacterized protein n=1 Tax=Smallanthus sonchifolius TaxID=185202 RepID=A0ACB9JF73_9ASTR|nr:hypothetical protein L1987_12130 [Smallanthus sonchifolius]
MWIKKESQKAGERARHSIPFQRIAWISIKGLPLQLWDEEIFNEIAGTFRKVIHPSMEAWSGGNLTEEKVVIVIETGTTINNTIKISCNRKLYPIYI